MTENGIKIVDVDGSEIEFNAIDAEFMRNYLNIKQERIAEIIRRQQREQKELRIRD